MKSERYVGSTWYRQPQGCCGGWRGRLLASGSPSMPAGTCNSAGTSKTQVHPGCMVAPVRQALDRLEESRALPGFQLVRRPTQRSWRWMGMTTTDRSDTWTDSRATRQAQAARAQDGKGLYRQTGCPPHAMYPLYKNRLAAREQPETFRKARRFASAKDMHSATERRMAGRLLHRWLVRPADPRHLDYNPTRWLCWLGWSTFGLGDRRQSFGRLTIPDTGRGKKKKKWACRPHSAGAGSSDAANCAIGAGAVLPSQATCMVGRSGGFFECIAHSRLLLSGGEAFGYAHFDQITVVGGH